MRTSWQRMALVLTMGVVATFGLGQPLPPAVTAQSVIVVDWKTGKVLYEKNADARRYPASTTKIMTALLALENLGPTTVLTAPSNIERVSGSSMYLKPGEQVSVDALLHGLMLRSANDGAEMLAVKMGGSLPGFARMMNQKALTLGCRGTRFVTPHGLPNDNHYTTARDLAKIASAAMHYPRFAEIVKTPSVTILRSMNLENTYLESTNSLLEEDTRVVGIKTGWTNAAGRCFVGASEQCDTTIITVILKSEKWQDDQIALMNWVDENFTPRAMVAEGDALGTVPLSGGWSDRVRVTTTGDKVLAWSGGEFEFSPLPKEAIKAPVKKGDRIGDVTVRLGTDEWIMPLLAAEDQAAKPMWAVMLTSPWTGAAMLGGVAGFVAVRRKPRRRRTVKRAAVSGVRPVRPASGGSGGRQRSVTRIHRW